MSIFRWAGFIADFPDDAVEEEEDFVALGGRNVAVALRDMISGLGYAGVFQPIADGDHGWMVMWDQGRNRYSCHVTSFHPAFLLRLEGPGSGRHSERPEFKSFLTIHEKLATALAQDPRFHDITWCAEGEEPPDPDEIGDPEHRRRADGIPPEPMAVAFRTRIRPSLSTNSGCMFLLGVLFFLIDAVVTAFLGLIVFFGGTWLSEGFLWFGLAGLLIGISGLVFYHRGRIGRIVRAARRLQKKADAPTAN